MVFVYRGKVPGKTRQERAEIIRAEARKYAGVSGKVTATFGEPEPVKESKPEELKVKVAGSEATRQAVVEYEKQKNANILVSEKFYQKYETEVAQPARVKAHKEYVERGIKKQKDEVTKNVVLTPENKVVIKTEGGLYKGDASNKYYQRIANLKKREEETYKTLQPGLERISKTASYLTFGGGKKAEERNIFGRTSQKVLEWGMGSAILTGALTPIYTEKALASIEGIFFQGKEQRQAVLVESKRAGIEALKVYKEPETYAGAILFALPGASAKFYGKQLKVESVATRGKTYIPPDIARVETRPNKLVKSITTNAGTKTNLVEVGQSIYTRPTNIKRVPVTIENIRLFNKAGTEIGTGKSINVGGIQGNTYSTIKIGKYLNRITQSPKETIVRTYKQTRVIKPEYTLKETGRYTGELSITGGGKEGAFVSKKRFPTLEETGEYKLIESKVRSFSKEQPLETVKVRTKLKSDEYTNIIIEPKGVIRERNIITNRKSIIKFARGTPTTDTTKKLEIQYIDKGKPYLEPTLKVLDKEVTTSKQKIKFAQESVAPSKIREVKISDKTPVIFDFYRNPSKVGGKIIRKEYTEFDRNIKYEPKPSILFSVDMNKKANFAFPELQTVPETITIKTGTPKVTPTNPSVLEASTFYKLSQPQLVPVKVPVSSPIIKTSSIVTPISITEPSKISEPEYKGKFEIISENEKVTEPAKVLEINVAKASHTRQLQAQITTTGTESTTTNVGITRFNPPRIPPTAKITPIFDLPKKELRKGKGQGVSLFVRQRGVFRKIGAFGSEREALLKGKAIISSTARASFKIQTPMGEQVSSRGLLPKLQFYKSNKEQNVFIERREKRIKSPGEKREITYKGIFASRMKSNRKKMFNFFGG